MSGFSSERVCDICYSKEGELRLIGNYVVELAEVSLAGEKKFACQSCRVKYPNFKKYESQPENRSLLKKIFFLS